MLMLAVLQWLAIVVAGLLVLAFAAGQAGLLQGQMPADLGVKDGRLKPPSLTENSVSSQAARYPNHPMQAYADIAPFPYVGDGKLALERIKNIVAGMEGARIIKSEPGYLYVQFTTKWLKFVDDVEFYVDESASVIQVRSASRIGRKDFGVNRARIEAIRARIGTG